MIQGIGKGGNPHTMSNITPGMVVGVGTEVLQGEGLLVTAGAIDCALCLLSPQSVVECLSVGVTTIFGGGNGSPSSSSMSTCGANHIKYGGGFHGEFFCECFFLLKGT
jgi:urease alpha subunit